ncbi:MAG: riboflavin synthase [Fimbriimonadaceae bacterium]|nr:riboflavin synthase [Fimbriimonadaceae bacterium]
MFTGLIQTVGRVSARSDAQLAIARPAEFRDVELGESIAVNGVCLTAVTAQSEITFDLSEETWQRTALGQLSVGDPVNLERAMRASDRLGGHVVQGHVDGVGTVVSVTSAGESSVWTFRVPDDLARFLVDKGSVAVDGISLTVVRPRGPEFDVAIIPHTLAHTNLHARRPGDAVNIEVDVLAKYVARLIEPYRSPNPA